MRLSTPCSSRATATSMCAQSPGPFPALEPPFQGEAVAGALGEVVEQYRECCGVLRLEDLSKIEALDLGAGAVEHVRQGLVAACKDAARVEDGGADRAVVEGELPVELGLFETETLLPQDGFAGPVQPHEPEQLLPMCDKAGADDEERSDGGPTHEGAGLPSPCEIVGSDRHGTEQHDVRHHSLQLPLQLVAPIRPGNARRRGRKRDQQEAGEPTCVLPGSRVERARKHIPQVVAISDRQSGKT